MRRHLLLSTLVICLVGCGTLPRVAPQRQKADEKCTAHRRADQRQAAVGITGDLEVDEEKHGPFLFGKRAASLSEASRSVGRRVLQANHPLANPGTIDRIWVQRGSGQVAIYYRRSCVEVIQNVAWDAGGERVDAAESFRQVSREMKGEFSVGTVFVRELGKSVVTLEGGRYSPANLDPGQGSVSLVVSNHLVQIYGHYPLGRLREIAASLS